MADTGWTDPSSVSNDSTVPASGDQVWNTPSNATTEDSTYADADTITAVNTTTEGLRAEYSFSVPAGKAIVGVQVRVKIFDGLLGGNGNAWVNTAVLTDGAGSSYGTVKTSLEEDFGSGLTTITIGGADDLWGAAGIDPTKVNTAGFGVAIQVERSSGAVSDVDPQVDVVLMRVFYDELQPVPILHHNYSWSEEG